MVKVKICGITNLEDANASVEAGCDALGFLFYRKSPRYVSPLLARKIIKQLPERIIKIGVFVNTKEKSVKKIARLCGLNMLQFHGNESVEFCNKFKHYKIIKAFRVRGKIDSEKIAQYKTFAYLFDAFSKNKFGGTGKKFNWNLVRHLGILKKPIFLSGGLSESNVQKAIKSARPDWIDVSSSLEIRPGKKDENKMKNFIAKVKKG